MLDEKLGRAPLCLLVPGLGNSGPDHWQTAWERERRDCERVDLGRWDAPERNLWVARIDQAVRGAACPVVLVAHSLGCIALAWWAALVGEAVAEQVRGALLVAPPDVDRRRVDERLGRFAPTPRTPLPFPATVVASRNDPYCTFERAGELAASWLARLIDAGAAGHLNADSRLGAWSTGQRLLESLAEA